MYVYIIQSLVYNLKIVFAKLIHQSSAARKALYFELNERKVLYTGEVNIIVHVCIYIININKHIDIMA